MKKNTKIVVILIVAILILVSVAFIWKSYTDPIIPDDYTGPIIPDGYTVLESSDYGPLYDGYPPYDVTPIITPDYAYPPMSTPREFMKDSDLVISGKVISFSESNWSTPDGQKPEQVAATSTFDENGKFLSISIKGPKPGEYIYTDMDVQVDTIYKGKLNSEIITIRLMSGTVGEFCMSRGGGLDARNYNEGDDVFLFLKYRYDEASGLYYLSSPQCAYIKL